MSGPSPLDGETLVGVVADGGLVLLEMRTQGIDVVTQLTPAKAREIGVCMIETAYLAENREHM